MKVLVLGATGNIGSRLLPALQAHGHQVVALVRSESKLKDLVPSSVTSRTAVIFGNADDSNTVREALVHNRCEALVNSAGLAAVFPWEAPRMQGIIQAVATAAVEASKEMGKPIRAWFLGGMTALEYPGFGGVRLPMFAEHVQTFAFLQSKPSENLQWSMLCPATMVPANQNVEALTTPRGNPLLAAKDVPSNFRDFYISWVPFLGPLVTIMGNAPKYNTKLEDCADFIAADLKSGGETFVGHRVGIFDTGKMKQT
ncbi:MAG: hypothetical protein Q9195_006351 [Heterodermia aff. obscurata]